MEIIQAHIMLEGKYPLQNGFIISWLAPGFDKTRSVEIVCG